MALTRTQLQFLTLQTAWKPITKTDGETINVLNDLESPVCKYLSDIVHSASDELDLGFDQAYEILYNAINTIDIDALQDYDYIQNQEYSQQEFASVYTHDRLSYLTVNNQYSIAQVLKETESEDIATACAIWYDRVCVHMLDNIFASLESVEPIKQ